MRKWLGPTLGPSLAVVGMLVTVAPVAVAVLLLDGSQASTDRRGSADETIVPTLSPPGPPVPAGASPPAPTPSGYPVARVPDYLGPHPVPRREERRP